MAIKDCSTKLLKNNDELNFKFFRKVEQGLKITSVESIANDVRKKSDAAPCNGVDIQLDQKSKVNKGENNENTAGTEDNDFLSKTPHECGKFLYSKFRVSSPLPQFKVGAAKIA